MRREIVLIIAVVLGLRLVAGGLSHLSQVAFKDILADKNIRVAELDTAKRTQQLSPVPGHQKINKRFVGKMPTHTVTPHSIIPANVMITAPNGPSAEELKAKRTAEEQKEKKRRKARKKKLEEMAKKESEKAKPKMEVTMLQDNQQRMSTNGGFENNNPPQSSYFPYLPPAPQAAPVTPPASSSKQPVDITRWINLLVHSPTAKDFASFQALYTSGQITANQYYQVLSAMVNSAIPDSRRFAVQGASIALRAESFEIVAHESLAETDANIQTLARTELARYAQVNEISILAQILRGGSIYAKIAAADTIYQVATTIRSTPNVTPAQLHSMFDAVVALLTPMMNDHSTPEAQRLAASATAAYNTIQNLFLGTPT